MSILSRILIISLLLAPCFSHAMHKKRATKPQYPVMPKPEQPHILPYTKKTPSCTISTIYNPKNNKKTTKN